MNRRAFISRLAVRWRGRSGACRSRTSGCGARRAHEHGCSRCEDSSHRAFLQGWLDSTFDSGRNARISDARRCSDGSAFLRSLLGPAGSFFLWPSQVTAAEDHSTETATLRVAYRIDSRPFSYVDAQGGRSGYTIEVCERIARSLEAQLNVALTKNGCR